MKTSKMHERIKWYKKNFVHNQYARIVTPFKDYEKITSVKMLDEIYKVYSNYNNIIDICTVRELKYIKMILDDNIPQEELLDNKYDWERKTLHNKFLVVIDYPDRVFIPDEIIDNVKEAIKNVNWKTAKKLDNINEILVSYCKIQASSLLDTVCSFGCMTSGISEKNIYTHILHNKVFNYYVIVYSKNIEGLGDNIYIALHQDYYSIEEQLDEQRKKQGLAGNLPIDPKMYKTLFYNDFDINNKKIKKMLTEIKKLPFFWFSALDTIREFAVLNIDRKPLKDAISNVPSLKKCNLTNFFKILDEAMDEMPSGALNGFTPNEAKQIKIEENRNRYEKEKNYTKQKNACLSKEDAKLFYKIYFGLLEFTNNKYKIKPNYKIYNKKGINPYDITDIIDKFWENKNTLTLEFCMANPYKFNSEELKLTSEFKKGIRDMFIIAKFYEEYTAVMNKEKTYMIKGINDNLDNIISYKKLPTPTMMTILPFKDVLIYDGVIMNYEVNLGSNFEKIVNSELSNSIKFYHL